MTHEPARCSACPVRSPATASTPVSPRTTATFNGEQRTLAAVTASSTSRTAASSRQRTRPAHLAALADDPALRGTGAGRPTAALILSPHGPRRARAVRRRRRRGLHRRTSSPGTAAALVGVAGPDAVHDAGRGRGRHVLTRRRRLAAPRTAGRPTAGTTSRPARPTSRRTPTQPGAAVRHVGLRGARASRRGEPASGWTPTTARSPTRSAGSGPRCTWTRAATAVRRPSRACTRSADRRVG